MVVDPTPDATLVDVVGGVELARFPQYLRGLAMVSMTAWDDRHHAFYLMADDAIADGLSRMQAAGMLDTPEKERAAYEEARVRWGWVPTALVRTGPAQQETTEEECDA
jgi:hypothetical protein